MCLKVKLVHPSVITVGWREFSSSESRISESKESNSSRRHRPNLLSTTVHITGQSASLLRLSTAAWQPCAMASLFLWILKITWRKHSRDPKQTEKRRTFFRIPWRSLSLTGNSPFKLHGDFCGGILVKNRLRLYNWQPAEYRMESVKL